MSISKCCSCGYRWETGTNGSHSCANELRKILDCLIDPNFKVKTDLGKEVRPFCVPGIFMLDRVQDRLEEIKMEQEKSV